jgi:hypothetical protein
MFVTQQSVRTGFQLWRKKVRFRMKYEPGFIRPYS